MTRLFLLLALSVALFSCGGGDTTAQTASVSAPASELKLNEKGRITSAITLTLADGPFAGTYELGNEKSWGNVSFSATTAEHVEKHPKFAGTSNMSVFSMLTDDDDFGILNMSRVFSGEPQTGHLPSKSFLNKTRKQDECGTMLLKFYDQPDIIRHVYVRFLECNGIDITGFGNEWKESKYTKKRKRPVAGKFSERVRIEDINSTNDTKEVHETTMTIVFQGEQSVEM